MHVYPSIDHQRDLWDPITRTIPVRLAYQNVLAELKRMMRSAEERGHAENDSAIKSGVATHVGNKDGGARANHGTQTTGGNNGGTV